MDNKNVLDPEDDVVRIKLGGTWRMPSIDEFEELRKCCTWAQETINGVSGYKVTSNVPGYTDTYSSQKPDSVKEHQPEDLHL